MKIFSESLMSELQQQLKMIHLQTENPIQSAENAMKSSVAALERLKTFFIKYKGLNKKEEIEFFRDIKPKFASKRFCRNCRA